jgi:hypothetical protein
VPLPIEPVLQFRDVFGCTVPWTRLRGARIEVERPQGVDDPLRGQMNLSRA